MRSAVSDFKNSEFIRFVFKIRLEPHQIAYSDCSGTFSLDVRLEAYVIRKAKRAIWHGAAFEHISNGAGTAKLCSNIGRLRPNVLERFGYGFVA